MNKLILTLISGLLIILILPIYIFFWTPRVEAKNYLNENYKDYKGIKGEIDGDLLAFYKQSNRDVGKSFDIFEDMKKSVTYEEALSNTRQDINLLEKAIKTIERAKGKKQKKELSISLESLDDYLDDYYDKADRALEVQLEYQEFQMDMIVANGQELEKKLLLMNELLSNYDPESWKVFFDELTPLVSDSYDNLKKLKSIPEMGRIYYDFRLNYLYDLKVMSEDVSKELGSSHVKNIEAAMELMIDFSEDLKLSEQARKTEMNDYLETSETFILIEELKSLEEKIDDEIQSISEKYLINKEEFKGQ